ncbi:Fatty acid oxidation complex subunit alpha [Gammaproteobacteria bacterium MOLA455]|nr:Fatty acid oxidation complex subunit alpha [Gammaproteobacteria bacterium MOLA455]
MTNKLTPVTPVTPVKIVIEGSVALINIDNPPVNALSQAVRQGLMECVATANSDPNIGTIVIACSGRTFVAGADISEFGKPPLEPHLPDVLNAIEQSPKPVIAALHGTVLGGGFELALSCHYRIALAGTKCGLPEVTLGLIPGAGGTQRLPRLCGIEKALEMITSGKSVVVEDLQAFGVVESVVGENLLGHAIEYGAQFSSQIDRKTPVPTSQIPAPVVTNSQLFDQWRAKLARRARGQLAPQNAIQAIENTTLYCFPEALAKERELFVECRNSSQSAAMRHAFFAERQVAKLDFLKTETQALPIAKVAVIGAGTMGCGIAICFASAGIAVRLLELKAENLQRGLNLIAERYAQSVDSDRIDSQTRDQCLALIQGTCLYEDLADVDLVIEAAFENAEVKRDIFVQLDQVCKPSAILASNTSYLDINAIAEVTARPEKVLGMHFFSPAHIMKLLEVVRAHKTDDQTLLTAMKLGKRIGKIAVPVGVCYGFVGNRMYSAYGAAANQLLLEGATPEQVDQAMEDWGMAMGPFAVADLSGIDIGYKARRENPHRPSDPSFFRPADLLVQQGRLGQKTEAGFYAYPGGKKQPDPEVIQLIIEEARRLKIPQRIIRPGDIQRRLITALIKEGEKILEQGIAVRAADIDVIWLNGYGFPRYRGGPMYFANSSEFDSPALSS